jgi:thioesterase domain-containing protein
MEVQEIPGTHLNIIKEPHVAELALKLGESLARAQGQHLQVVAPITMEPGALVTGSLSGITEPQAA